MHTVFKADAAEGIVLARLLHYAKPVNGLHGVSDREIYNRGFLNFNYHPDQIGSGPFYSTFDGYGTKVDGLPVRLMEGMETSMERISEGRLFPASSMRSKAKGHNDGAILLARFSPDQVATMGIGVNLPFDSGMGQPFAELVPDVRNGELFLKIKESNTSKIDPTLRERFDPDGHLTGSYGEFYVQKMPHVNEYRDRLLVFRPDRKGSGFRRRYWAKDIARKSKAEK